LPFLKRIYKEIHNATDSGYLKFSKGFLQLINYNITDFSEEVQIEHINLLLSYKTVVKIKNFTALLAQFPSLTRLDISCQIKFIANLFELAKDTKNYELLKHLPILNEENVETILDKAFDIAISLKKPLILLTVASINSFTTPKSIQEKFTERLFSLADSSETLELFQESLFKILQFLGSKTDEGYYEPWNPAIKSIVNLLDSLLASTDSAEKLWVLQHTFSKIATNDIITPPALKEAIINKLLDIAKSATAPWLVENILPKFIKTIDSMSTAKQISFINNLFTITHRDTLMSLLSNTKLLKSKAFEEFSKSFNAIKEKAQTSFIESLPTLLDESSDPKIVIQILQKIPGLFDKMPSSTQVEFITKLFTYSLKTQNVEILEVICDKFTSISDAAQIKFITELLRADRLSFINEKSQAIKIIAENIEDLSDEVSEKFIAELFGARSSAIKRASSLAIAKNLPKLSDAVQIKFVTELAQSKWGMLVREPLIAIIKNIQSIRDEILITLVTELFKTTNPCKEVYLGKIAAKFTVLSDAVQTKFATEFSLPLATFKKTAIIKKMADDIVEV
jgi:hypothetical protein